MQFTIYYQNTEGEINVYFRFIQRIHVLFNTKKSPGGDFFYYM